MFSRTSTEQTFLKSLQIVCLVKGVHLICGAAEAGSPIMDLQPTLARLELTLISSAGCQIELFLLPVNLAPVLLMSVHAEYEKRLCAIR